MTIASDPYRVALIKGRQLYKHIAPITKDEANTTACSHQGIARVESNPAWCTDCHAWVVNQ